MFERYSTPVYIDCTSLSGIALVSTGTRWVAQDVIGTEICQVDSPSSTYEALGPHISGELNVTGVGVTFAGKDDSELSHVFNWTLKNSEGRPFLFAPNDIEQLASFLKPDQGEKADTSHVPDEETNSPSGSKREARLEIIRRWFGEQQTYPSTGLSSLRTGLPGARDACWQWLVKSELTAKGGLFCGATQINSSKSKKFVSAWNEFLKEVNQGRPKN